MSTLKNKYSRIYIFDVDGVLVEPNHIEVPKETVEELTYSNAFIALASGKTVDRCLTVGQQINADAVFGENGAVYQMCGGGANYTTADMAEIKRLKYLLKFRRVVKKNPNDPPQAVIVINKKVSRVIYEPGKEILTLWTRPVKGRWENFTGSRFTEAEVIEGISEIIKNNGLKIEIIGPHSDGGIDFMPVGIDKSISVGLLKQMLPDLPVFVFVDGDNDIGLTEHPDTFVVTFSNATPKIMSAAKKKIEQGMALIITDKMGYECGVSEALRIIHAGEIQ